MLAWYRAVMDSDRNPLRELPPPQKFQIMTILSLMWTAIFCAITGAWIWYGELVAAHALVALGLVITTITFKYASEITAGSTRGSVAKVRRSKTKL